MAARNKIDLANERLTAKEIEERLVRAKAALIPGSVRFDVLTHGVVGAFAEVVGEFTDGDSLQGFVILRPTFRNADRLSFGAVLEWSKVPAKGGKTAALRKLAERRPDLRATLVPLLKTAFELDLSDPPKGVPASAWDEFAPELEKEVSLLTLLGVHPTKQAFHDANPHIEFKYDGWKIELWLNDLYKARGQAFNTFVSRFKDVSKFLDKERENIKGFGYAPFFDSYYAKVKDIFGSSKAFSLALSFVTSAVRNAGVKIWT